VTVIGGTGQGSETVALAERAPFTLGRLHVDPPRRTLTTPDGVAEQIEPKMMQMLAVLSEAPGVPVGRPVLIDRCWEGRHVTSDAVDRVVAKLRRTLERLGEGSVALTTLPRVGLRLDVTPELASEPAPAAPSSAKLERRQVLAASAGGVVLLAAGAAAWRAGRSAERAGLVWVLVQPFDNVSRRLQLDYLAAGVARQVREQLSRIANLRVFAEGSSGAPGKPPPASVRPTYIVRGRVRKVGDDVQVAATLIAGDSGAILWTKSFDAPVPRLLELQDRLAGALLRELVWRAGLAAEDGAGPAPRRRNGLAYPLILEGEDQLEVSRASRMAGNQSAAFDAADRAYDLARRALAIDPADPGALLLLARLTRNGWTRAMDAQPLTVDQRVAASLQYITRALASDPNDPAALTALGDYYRRSEWRWREAETLFRRALAISPSYLEAHWSYGYLLGVTGRALGGLAHARQVALLDPETTWRRVALPRLLYVVGDRAGALRRYDAELAATPANLFLVEEIYLLHLCEGDAAGIERLAQRTARLGEDVASPASQALLAKLTSAAAALRGRPAAFLDIVDGQVARYDERGSTIATRQARLGVDLLYIAALEYAWAGATDRALACFARALRQRSLYWPATLPYGNTPVPAQIGNDPRYRALWTDDPKLVQLTAMRRRALAEGQLAGVTDDGRRVRPPQSVIDRVLNRSW
jgi:TolB-like protein/DNA-binding winged helix-turn-helix (wHTH) protein